MSTAAICHGGLWRQRSRGGETHFRLRFCFADVRFVGFTCSGSVLLPVSRFHSSNVSGEIFPLTRSSANLRRCA